VVAINVTVPSLDIFGGVIPQEGAGSRRCDYPRHTSLPVPA
jgi:hypothetical protein